MFGRAERRQRRGNRMLWTGFTVTALLILLVLVLLLVPQAERGDRSPVEGTADWMARLDDGLPLNRIVLPGTHNSATQHVQLAFLFRCQSLSVAEQLEAGYRYLDIRLGEDEHGGLKLIHNFAECKTGFGPQAEALTLEELLRQCRGFLAQHPTEAVVFAVKHEHGDMATADFEALLDNYVRRDPDCWLLNDSVPSLGAARGKLVLMRRYEDEADLGPRAGIPLLWAGQGGTEDTSLNTAAADNGGYTLWVQDRFEYDLGEKWSAFCAGLDNGAGVRDISLNFLSTKGSFVVGHPYFFASRLNGQLSRLSLSSQPFPGWIVVDFGSAALARHIYGANFT